MSSGRDIARSFVVAADLGIEVLELACQHRENWPSEVSAVRRRDIRSMADHQGLELVVHSDSAVNVAEQHPTIRDAVVAHLADYVELTADVGATRLVVHGGLEFDGSPLTAALDAGVDTLAKVTRLAESVGITLVLENMNRLDSEIDYFGVTAADVIAVLDAIDSPALRACADLGHAHLLPGGIDDFVTALGTRIDYVQLTDNDGSLDRHLPLGAGTMDLTTIVAALDAVDYSGPVVAELDDESDRRASVVAMRAAFPRCSRSR